MRRSANGVELRDCDVAVMDTRERACFSWKTWGVLVWVSLGTGCTRGSPSLGMPNAPLAPQTVASERCAVAASLESPLVTEWSAADKAHLESLVSHQVVAVEYSGCELSIVPECRPPGSYAWNVTTLATDTVEIHDTDELYAKLPLGAIALESELRSSGSLAVQTTVSGQLRLDVDDVQLPQTESCSRATHWVRAVSVGAFKLFSGGGSRDGTDVAGVAEGGRVSSEKQSILREAGQRDACREATEAAMPPQCGSPIQIFLEPVGRSERDALLARAKATGSVRVEFASPEADDEGWTLRDPAGQVLCATPCRHWVPPTSGYYLQREATDSAEVVQLRLPNSFPVAPGGELRTTYRAERGAPFASKLLFWGLGVPLGATGVAFSAVTVDAYAAEACDDDCQFDRSVLLPLALSYFAVTAGLYYWYSWSHAEGLEVTPASSTGPEIGLAPGGLTGRF